MSFFRKINVLFSPCPDIRQTAEPIRAYSNPLIRRFPTERLYMCNALVIQNLNVFILESADGIFDILDAEDHNRMVG